MGLAKRLLELYRPFWARFVLLLLVICLSDLTAMAIPIAMGRIIDLLSVQSPSRVSWIVGIIIFVFGLKIVRAMVFDLGEGCIVVNYLDADVPGRMRMLATERMLSFSIGQHASSDSGVNAATVNSGQEALHNFAKQMTGEVIPRIVCIGISMAVLAWISPIAAVGLVITTSITVWAVVRQNNDIREELQKLQKLKLAEKGFYNAVMNAIRLFIGFGREDRALSGIKARFDTWAVSHRALWTPYLVRACARGLAVATFETFVVSLGAYYVLTGTYSPGYVIMLLGCANRGTDQLNMIGRLTRNVTESWSSIEEYIRLIDIPPDVTIVATPIKLSRYGKIEFRNVTLRYRGRGREGTVARVNALDGINFTIEPGEMVALVGDSGAGKTSIIYTLLRGQDPDDGQVFIDGHDLRLLDLRHFRELVGLVPQQSWLFNTTLRENMQFGLPEGVVVSDDDLDRISRMARIDQFFGKLEEGYDTVVGEHGVKLSGGEAQRVGIARVLLKNPSILIFDEATSALDIRNEKIVQESMEAVAKGRTTIVIAHRLSTIARANKIIVLDGGKVVGVGTPGELYSICPHYKEVVDEQLMSIQLLTGSVQKTPPVERCN